MSELSSPVENGKSAVAGTGRREMTMGTKIGLITLFGLIALTFVWLSAAFHHAAPASPKGAESVYTSGGSSFISMPATKPATPEKVQATVLPEPTTQAQTSVFGGQAQASPAQAPIMSYSGGGSAGSPTPQQQNTAAADAAPGGPAGAALGSAAAALASQDKSPLAEKLQPTVLDGEQAAVLPNPDTTITEGTPIPCILQSAINSELPGLVTCIVPQDIRGTTGNVVLLDRGTKIVGQIESGLMQGQNRVFVDWTRAETPDHVIITLDSPGTDDLGESGLPGAVDNHFWQRFGGALMLTVVEGALNAATVEAAGQGASTSTSQEAAVGFVNSGQQNTQTIANTALQNSINIAPTLTKNQGDTVALIVAHDLDFSSVYKLQIKDVP